MSAYEKGTGAPEFMKCKNTSSIAAFFDFDKTLLIRDSAAIGITYLWKKKEISSSLMVRILVAHQLFKKNILSAETMTNLVLELYRGKQLKHFQDGVGDFYVEYLKPWLSPKMVKRLEFHRSQGHYLVLLSASVRYMLQEVVRDLHFDHLICTDLAEGDDGALLGKPLNGVCIGRKKAQAARALADDCGLNLSESYAYGDHNSDRYILESVGNPFVVRPDTKMRKIAVEKKWPIFASAQD